MVVAMASDSRHAMSESGLSEEDEEPEVDTRGGAKRRKRSSRVDKESDEYRQRRDRNNLAVKKSRSKSKMKTQETLERVNKLRAENEMLEAKINLLSKELGFLKDLFLAHAGSAHGQSTLQDIDLSMFGEPANFATTGSLGDRAATVSIKSE